MRHVARLFAVVVPAVALVACVEAEPPQLTGLTPGDTCNAERYGGLIGEGRAEAEALAAELGAEGQPVRIVGPGDPVTRDFLADRINVILGPDDRIQLLRCG